MKIAPGVVVTMAYELATDGGQVIESSKKGGPLVFMHGKGVMLPGLDKRLEGMTKGDSTTFELAPEEAFGRVEDAPTRKIARSEFPPQMDLKIGLSFAADLPGGQTIRLEVVEIAEAEVTVRMVHPLAGKRLKMTVDIVGVRPASAPEKAAGRAL